MGQPSRCLRPSSQDLMLLPLTNCSTPLHSSPWCTAFPTFRLLVSSASLHQSGSIESATFIILLSLSTQSLLVHTRRKIKYVKRLTTHLGSTETYFNRRSLLHIYHSTFYQSIPRSAFKPKASSTNCDFSYLMSV